MKAWFAHNNFLVIFVIFSSIFMVFLLISIQLCDKNFWNIYFYTRLLKVNIFKKFQILQDFQTYLNLKKAALINSPMEGMSLKKFRCLYCLLRLNTLFWFFHCWLWASRYHLGSYLNLCRNQKSRYISSSRHEQVCLNRLRFEGYFSHHRAILPDDGRSISRNVASLTYLLKTW